MRTTMGYSNQTKILLESGTNELEIIEFKVGGELFGINIAKIREIIRAHEVKPMPNSHNVVEGIFKQRGDVITVIDLAKCLELSREEDDRSYDIFLLTYFNKLNFAFRVERVVGIDRVSWEDIRKPDSVIYGGKESIATGIAEYKDRLITILDFEKIIADISPESFIAFEKLDNLGEREESDKKILVIAEYKDRLITILDFEKIIADISPESFIAFEKLDNLGEREESDKKILVVEDSVMLSNLIIKALHKSGYKNTIKFNNGKEAWEYLTEAKNSDLPISEFVSCVISDIEMPLMDGHRLTKLIKEDSELKVLPVILEAKNSDLPISEFVSCVISDIEMPLMDGHRLTKLIKEDSELKVLPVILFSSLISDEIRIKGEEVGADEQINKPEICGLVNIIDRLI